MRKYGFSSCFGHKRLNELLFTKFSYLKTKLITFVLFQQSAKFVQQVGQLTIFIFLKWNMRKYWFHFDRKFMSTEKGNDLHTEEKLKHGIKIAKMKELPQSFLSLVFRTLILYTKILCFWRVVWWFHVSFWLILVGTVYFANCTKCIKLIFSKMLVTLFLSVASDCSVNFSSIMLSKPSRSKTLLTFFGLPLHVYVD
jgi:hypothetical protein